jgi:hypothetical protein
VEVDADGPERSPDVVTELRRVRGTPAAGVWRGSLRLPDCPAASGKSPLNVWVTDARGHATRYTSRTLKAAGWPAALRIRALPDALPPRARRIGGYEVRLRGPVRISFTEAVNGLTEASAPLSPVDLETEEPGPALPGIWRCRDANRVLTDCGTGSVRRAALHLDARLIAGQEYQVSLNPEHVLALTDLAGNPFDRDRLFFRGASGSGRDRPSAESPLIAAPSTTSWRASPRAVPDRDRQGG